MKIQMKKIPMEKRLMMHQDGKEEEENAHAGGCANAEEGGR